VQAYVLEWETIENRGIVKTFNLAEAAQFLRIHPDTLQRRAAAGEIPGAKPGKCWVFVDVDLVEWLRTSYKTTTALPRVESPPFAESAPERRRSEVTDADLFSLLSPAKKRDRKNRETMKRKA